MIAATLICTEQDCNQPKNRPNQPLCYDDYLELRDGTISLCSDCQVTYKPAKYQLCRDCNQKQPSGPESGEGWDLASRPPPPAELVEAVELVSRNISEHADACVNNETNTTQYLVEPMLIGLGWDIYNPDLVIKEYRVEGKKRFRRNIRVDIALLGDDCRPFAFIEVKRLDRDYDPRYMGQLEGYASHMDSGIAVLTNGRHWLISNVTDGVSQPHRTVNILDGSAESVAEQLNRVLGRAMIAGSIQSATPPVRVARPSACPPTSAQIMEALRNYREAQRQGRPAFTIFNDETIALIAERKPANTAELQSIKGVGPTTLRQHGEAILKIVAGRME